MARSLKGQRFFFCTNNGVTGVLDEKILRNIERRANIERTLGEAVGSALDHLPQTPVFTFADSSGENLGYFVTSHMRWVATALKRYIVAMGGTYEGGSFYVPFSNQWERRRVDRKTQALELRYVTSEQQFEETFGVSLNEIEYLWCETQVQSTMYRLGLGNDEVERLMSWFKANIHFC